MTIHLPNRLHLQQLIGRWLLVRVCYPTDDQNCGNSRYRILNLASRTWCTGELIAATGFCHLHTAPEEAESHITANDEQHATVNVFIGYETNAQSLASTFCWQLLTLGHAPPRLVQSGCSPYWPMLVRKKGKSIRLDAHRVLLTVDFGRPTSQTYIGVLLFGTDQLQWRESLRDTIVTCMPERNTILTRNPGVAAARRYTLRQLNKGEDVSKYSLPDQYRFHCVSSRLAYVYSPKTADSFSVDLITGDTFQSIDPSGLATGQLSLTTPTQLILLHPRLGKLIICDFAANLN
jgi:hypothetical protein